MSRRTIGEELQYLFARRDQGLLPEDEFQRRKAHLLRVSACRLPALMPDPVGTAAKAVAITGGAALVVLAAISVAG
ncbi:MAG: SHOCT domain-containing protein [Sphingomonas sp.]|jgi:hypothetical protein|uniref:SHOCT domain-containing protein n=1 Tax=Sphingomonas sp. TaxID=28214 RepID=UPI003566523E